MAVCVDCGVGFMAAALTPPAPAEEGGMATPVEYWLQCRTREAGGGRREAGRRPPGKESDEAREGRSESAREEAREQPVATRGMRHC